MTREKNDRGTQTLPTENSLLGVVPWGPYVGQPEITPVLGRKIGLTISCPDLALLIYGRVFWLKGIQNFPRP